MTETQYPNNPKIVLDNGKMRIIQSQLGFHVAVFTVPGKTNHWGFLKNDGTIALRMDRYPNEGAEGSYFQTMQDVEDLIKEYHSHCMD